MSRQKSTTEKKSAGRQPKKIEAKSPAEKVAEKPAGRQPKKIEAKSPVEKVTEKPARKSTITAELQYSGKAIPISEIYSRAKEACGNDSDINIYIKPEENRVYYVSDGNVGSFEI